MRRMGSSNPYVGITAGDRISPQRSGIDDKRLIYFRTATGFPSVRCDRDVTVHPGMHIALLSDMHTRATQRTGVLFPWPPKKYRGIKPSAVGSAQRVRERTGVTEGMVVRKNHTLLSKFL